MQTYNPKKVGTSFDGAILSGFAKGTFIEAEFNEDAFKADVGSDGEGARTASADESVTVKLTLMQQSASNDILSAKHRADKRTNAGTGPLFIKDASGRTLINIAEAWIKKMAPVVLADGSNGREWTFEACKGDIAVGGN